MDLKIISINCNGLNMTKCSSILATEISNLTPDICFLQETHISDFSYAKHLADSKFHMKAFWSLATSRHSGTCILLSPSLNCTVKN